MTVASISTHVQKTFKTGTYATTLLVGVVGVGAGVGRRRHCCEVVQVLVCVKV